MNSAITILLSIIVLPLIARGAKTDPGDPSRYLTVWRSLDGNFYEEAGWLGWWTIVEHGTVFMKGHPPI